MTAASLNHSWPVLVRSLQQCRSNLKVVEKTGKAITHALQSAGRDSAGLLPQILETIAAQFQQTQHPCMLYIASELLKTYGKDAQYQAALGELSVAADLQVIRLDIMHAVELLKMYSKSSSYQLPWSPKLWSIQRIDVISKAGTVTATASVP